MDCSQSSFAKTKILNKMSHLTLPPTISIMDSSKQLTRTLKPKIVKAHEAEEGYKR